MPNNTHLQITPTHGNVEVETGVPPFSVYVSKYKNMYARPSEKSNLGSFLKILKNDFSKDQKKKIIHSD